MIKRLLLVSLLAGCAGETREAPPSPEPPPPEATAEQRALVGEYAVDGDTISVLEAGGDLRLLDWRLRSVAPLSPGGTDPAVVPVYDDEGGVRASRWTPGNTPG